MAIYRYFRLLFECFKLSGATGVFCGLKYLCGLLRLPEIDVKSSDLDGDLYV